MAAISGQGGSVKMGTQVVANLGTWELTITGDHVDTTPFQSAGAWKQFTPTVKTWTGKATGRHDSTDTLGQVALINALGTVVTMTFMVDGTHQWTGTAILNGLHPKADANNVVTNEFDFQGAAALTY